MKIAVGVSTYGVLERVNKFIRSYWNTLEESTHTILPVCVDDGTPDPSAVRERAEFCKKWKFEFLPHRVNRGIPAAWNTILQFAKSNACDLAIIFNDDVYFLRPGWISHMAFFFQQNNPIGAVGYPLVNEKGFDDSDTRWDGGPGLCGAPVGCSFAVAPNLMLSIENPDGSLGYWEDLISFHEETHAGFRLAQAGAPSFMLPWPPVRHEGGQTFHTNPTLALRAESEYLPMAEFLDYARSSAFYLPEYEAFYARGQVDRMMYSRAMFCKYWGILNLPRIAEVDGQEVDIWNEPQRYVHQLVVPTKLHQEIQHIDKFGKIQKNSF